jgi:hypothetical protein
MRTVAAELRAAGEMPAPAHFGLLTMLGNQPRTLTELALLQGVSLPTMSNSISTMVQRGWVKRSSPARDRRVVLIEVTPLGERPSSVSERQPKRTSRKCWLGSIRHQGDVCRLPGSTPAGIRRGTDRHALQAARAARSRTTP